MKERVKGVQWVKLGVFEMAPIMGWKLAWRKDDLWALTLGQESEVVRAWKLEKK